MIDIICVSVLYILFCLVIIFPPEEFVSSGLCIEKIFGSYLGSEDLQFVQYHIKRSAVTLLFHSFLFPGYFLCLLWMDIDILYWYTSNLFGVVLLLVICLIPLVVALAVVLYWASKNWQCHPFANILLQYSEDIVAWQNIASEINFEFRRIDKFSTKINSISRVVATNNWMFKISPYSICGARLEDVVLILEDAFEAGINPSHQSATQFLTIRVNVVRTNVPGFVFRINSLYLENLEEKLVNPLVNAKHFEVQKSIADRFFTAFTDAVHRNPLASVTEEPETCIGCMSTRANVKLDRLCSNAAGQQQCVPCSCKPMWCLSCLSRWFAARQDENHPETWLSSKAPCPTCRSVFCLLDVRVLDI